MITSLARPLVQTQQRAQAVGAPVKAQPLAVHPFTRGAPVPPVQARMGGQSMLPAVAPGKSALQPPVRQALATLPRPAPVATPGRPPIQTKLAATALSMSNPRVPAAVAHAPTRAAAKSPCCEACSPVAPFAVPHAPAPRTIGRGTIQRSAVEEKSSTLLSPSAPSKGAPKKSAKDKKAEKQSASGARRLLLVLAERQKKLEACEAGVTFSQHFNTHVMRGQGAGTTHSGYHSQSETNFAAFGVCVITDALDAYGVLKADCTMNGRTVAKNSSFFPAGWDIHRIRAEAKHAYCRQIDRGGIPGAGALAWVGPSTVDGLLIGGASGLPLNTAFPSYNGGF